MRTCELFIEDEIEWKKFLITETKEALWDMLDKIRTIRHSLRRKEIPLGHLDERIDIGLRFYKRRLKEEWFPF